LYTVSEGRARWYFVRIETPATRLLIAGEPSAARFPLLMNIEAFSGKIRAKLSREIAGEFGRRTGTAGARTSYSELSSRGWTWLRRLDLRQQWHVLLHQARLWADVSRKMLSETPERKGRSKPLSANAVDRRVR
jgi:hypothetical protein